MSLYLKTDTNMIYMRKKDSGVVRFLFDHDMTGVYVTFAVKRNREDPDEDAVIAKSYRCGMDPTVSTHEAYFLIRPDDTSEMEVEPLKEKFTYQDYYWMLKVETNGGTLADTVIPSDNANFPKFRLYYGSVPDFDIDNTGSCI